MRYSTVVFDIGNVLCSFDLSRTLRAWLPFVPDGVERIKRVVPPLKERVESGAMGTQEFVVGTMSALGFTGSEADFKRGWVEIFDKIAGTHALVDELAGKVRLLILSNTNELHWDYLRLTYPVFQKFEGYVVSHEAGLAKPNPAIYSHLANKFGVSPSESLFIDDLAENIEAAERSGFSGFQFNYLDELHLMAVREKIGV
jgi:putative hydrolase of the HAD superfamily